MASRMKHTKSPLAKYEGVNNSQRLSVDPVMRAVTGKKRK